MKDFPCFFPSYSRIYELTAFPSWKRGNLSTFANSFFLAFQHSAVGFFQLFDNLVRGYVDALRAEHVHAAPHVGHGHLLGCGNHDGSVYLYLSDYRKVDIPRSGREVDEQIVQSFPKRLMEQLLQGGPRQIRASSGEMKKPIEAILMPPVSAGRMYSCSSRRIACGVYPSTPNIFGMEGP